MTKYGNHRTTYNGIIFDSAKEANKCAELDLLLLDKSPNGVRTYSRQPVFDLQEKFKKDGVTYQPIRYIGDFDVTYNDGRREIIDIKSKYTAKLPTFRIKQRLFDYKFPELTLVIEI